MKFFGDVIDRNYDVITFISENLSFKKAYSIFVDIVKIATIFIKAIFRDSKKLKRIRNYVCISWYNKTCWFPVKECLCQQNSRSVSRDLYIFDFRQVRYNCVTFHHCRICVTDFREEGIFAHPHPLICEQSKKGPSWIRLMALPTNCFQQSYRATQF